MPTGSMVFLVFTGVVTFAVLVQTVVLVAIIVAAKAAQRKIMEQVEKLHDELLPVLTSHCRSDGTGRRYDAASSCHHRNVQTASERLRQQVDHIDGMVADVTGKTRHQVTRIDGMVTDTLDGVARGTRTIQDNVMAPLRQIGGWMNTIRTALDLLRRGRRHRRPGTVTTQISESSAAATAPVQLILRQRNRKRN